MMIVPGDPEALLTLAEVARLFRVDPKTVTRWTQQGRLDCIRTLGGWRRFRVRDLNEAIARMNGGPGGER
jgi:excisionase family DNA binding protein